MLLTRRAITAQTKIRQIFLALFFITISLAPQNAQAWGRFIIPGDNDVLKVINQTEKTASLESVVPRDDIKVLVWNMYKAGKDSWASDYRKLIKNVDILMLQEIFTVPKMIHEIRRDTGRLYFLATSFKDKKKNLARTGTATASRFSPVSVGWQRSRYREPIIRTPKMVSIAEYDLSGTDDNLLTLNIHAINFVSTRKLKHMIVTALERAAKHRGPVVFAGDFNTWSKRKLRMMYREMNRYNFKEVRFPRLGKDDGRMKTFGNILDHVFVRDLKVKKAKVYANIEGSDHKAMEVHFVY